MPYYSLAVLYTGIYAYMGPVSLIVVVIPQDQVTWLGTDALQIFDPVIIRKSLDFLSAGTSGIYDLAYIVIVDPGYRGPPGL